MRTYRIVGAGVVVAIVVITLFNYTRVSSAVASKPNFEVGKEYNFTLPEGTLPGNLKSGRVLEVGNDGWIKVKFSGGGGSYSHKGSAWINTRVLVAMSEE